MTVSSHGVERRTNPHLRGIFSEAYEMLKPFFDQANTWGGQNHEHLAYRALHEQLPDLSHQDVFVLVAAAKRISRCGVLPAKP